MTEYQAMSVGGRFAYRNADQVIRGRDIMLLDWDPSGFILIIAMTGMTDCEAEIIRKHQMTVSAFTDREYVLPLWRFADSDVYGETPFDPTVYRSHIPGSREQIMRTGLVTIVGVDSNTMTIRAPAPPATCLRACLFSPLHPAVLYDNLSKPASRTYRHNA